MQTLNSGLGNSDSGTLGEIGEVSSCLGTSVLPDLGCATEVPKESESSTDVPEESGNSTDVPEKEETSPISPMSGAGTTEQVNCSCRDHHSGFVFQSFFNFALLYFCTN